MKIEVITVLGKIRKIEIKWNLGGEETAKLRF